MVSETDLADMIATLTCREELPERTKLGLALIELRQLRRKWQQLERRLPDVAETIENELLPARLRR